MNDQNLINSKNSNFEIVELNPYSAKIHISGNVSLNSVIEVEKYFTVLNQKDHLSFFILDFTNFISLEFEAKQFIHEKNFTQEKFFDLLIYGLKPEFIANLHLLCHNDSNINVFEFENETQALLKAKELTNKAKMDILAIGPSSFTGIIKTNIKVKDKSYTMIHDKSWNYKHPDKTYYYKIDLIDANILVSRPAGYIELENSLSANVLFDKVVFKLLSKNNHYYRIQDYTEVMSSSLAARRDFTNYIINNINRIDLMVFYGLNSFMKAIVKFGKLIHPKFYKVKIADSFEEAMSLVLNHKYGQNYFKTSADVEEKQISNGDVLIELRKVQKENEELKAINQLGKKKLLEAIGGVLWANDYELDDKLQNPSDDYIDIFNALKVLKQDIKEINYKREDTVRQLLRQTQVLTKEVKRCKGLTHEVALERQNYFNAFNFEIRSPFQSIQSNVELLSRMNKSLDQKDIIAQLLDSSLLINKRLRKHFEETGTVLQKNESSYSVFNIVKTLKSIINANIQNSSTKGLELVFEKGDHVPDYVIGDEDKIRLIVEQFVENSIYYSNDGKIIIRIVLIEDFETSANISIEVEDNGVGIFNEQIRDFEGEDVLEFEAWQNKGVEVTLLEQLADVINGKIKIDSIKTKGTTFSLQIKLNKGVFSKEMNLKPRVLAKNLNSKKLSKKTALFVVEDSSLEPIYLSQFNQIGVSIKFANNKNHAVSLLKSEKYDYVLAESPAKESDACELLSQIQETLIQSALRSKVVFLMASPDIDYKERLLSLGCEYFIYKPYQTIELKKILESLV